MSRFSFIIPSYNSFLTIIKTLESIFNQNIENEILEVIVVDSSNDQKTRHALDAIVYQKLKVIKLSEKTIPSAGRNIGAASAVGEVLCFIDSDVCLASDWAQSILMAYGEGARVGGGSVSVPEWQAHHNLALAQLYLQFNETLAAGEMRQVSILPACNLFVAREVFSKTKGFPLVRASEDTLFCLQLENIEKIWFVPSAKCFHIFREEWPSFVRNQELLGKYISVYRKMHYKSILYKGILPVILLPGFLIVKVGRMILRIKRAGRPHFARFLNSSGIFLVGIFYWSVGFVKGCFERNENT